MGKNAKLKEAQKWSNERLHLENARKLRGIYFIDLEDKEFKETIQDCVSKNLYRIIMRTILQERVTNHYSITIWFTNLFLCLKL